MRLRPAAAALMAASLVIAACSGGAGTTSLAESADGGDSDSGSTPADGGGDGVGRSASGDDNTASGGDSTASGGDSTAEGGGDTTEGGDDTGTAGGEGARGGSPDRGASDPDGAEDAGGSDPVGRSAEGGVDTECPPTARADFIRCLEVSVPLDHDDPGAGTIDLAVAVVDRDDEVVDSPVVFLNGGPGGGIIEFAAAFIGMPFDVVLVDLRGTGLSQPSLDCPGIDDAFAELAALPADDEGEARYDGLVAECRDQHLDAGVDFAAFDTAATAADVALLRTALGYDEWNLWGSSYGTRVALAVLRGDPSGVRSVVLDATFPPDVDFFGELPANAARSFEALASACAADEDCDERFGDLTPLMEEVAAELAEEPVTVTALRPVSGDRIEVLVDDATFWSILFDQLYDSRVIGRLPLLLERAADGDLSELVQRFVDGRDPEVLEFSEALYDVVMCADEVPFMDPDVLDAGLAGRSDGFVEAFDTGVVVEDCEPYGLEPSPALEDEAVTSDVPALLFTGRFDPVTPPEWTYRAAETLSRSTVVEMPARGHGLAIGDRCTAEIMFEFLADPADEPDLSCVDEADPPLFEVTG